MLTGHEKPLREYSNPFLMFARKYKLNELDVYGLVGNLHPTLMKGEELPEAETAKAMHFSSKIEEQLGTDTALMHVAVAELNTLIEILYNAHGLTFNGKN